MSDTSRPGSQPYGPDQSWGGEPTRPLPTYGSGDTQPLPASGSDPSQTRQLPPYQPYGDQAYGQPPYGSQQSTPNQPYGQQSYAPQPGYTGNGGYAGHAGSPGYGGNGGYGPGSQPPAGATPPPRKGMPGWAWALIALLALALIGGIVAAVLTLTRPKQPAATEQPATPAASSPAAPASSAKPSATRSSSSAPSSAKPSRTTAPSSSPSTRTSTAVPSGSQTPHSLADLDALSTKAGITCSDWETHSEDGMDGKMCHGGASDGAIEIYNADGGLDDEFWLRAVEDSENPTPLYVVTDKDTWAVETVLNRKAADSISKATGQPVYRLTKDGLVAA